MLDIPELNGQTFDSGISGVNCIQKGVLYALDRPCLVSANPPIRRVNSSYISGMLTAPIRLAPVRVLLSNAKPFLVSPTIMLLKQLNN